MRTFRNVCFIALLFLTILPTIHAQETTTVIGFSASGVQHTVRYVNARASLVDVVVESVTRSMEIYERLWGTTRPTVFVDIVDTSGTLGEDASAGRSRHELVPAPTGSLAEPSRQDVCYVRVQRTSGSEIPADELRFILAHEISHCYQDYNGLELEPSQEEDSRWWSEGSADWMASLVYSPSFGGTYWSAQQSLFISRLGGELLVQTYDASFFWQFLASQLGETAVIQILRGMPHDPAEHEAYMFREIPNLDRVLHDFGLAVAQRHVTDLPDEGVLWGHNVRHVSGVPADIQLRSERLSMNLYTIQITGLEPGTGVYLTPSDLASTGTRLSLSDGTLLPETTPIRICDGLDQLRLVVSRGRNNESSYATLNISSTPCPTPTPPTPEGPIPSCMVGTWYVAQLPVIPNAPTYTVTHGYQQVEIAADGQVNVDTSNFTITANSSPQVSVTIESGTASYRLIAVDALGNMTATDLESQTGAITADVGGQIVHMDPSTLSGPSVGVPGNAVCEADGTLTFTFEAGGASFAYGLTPNNPLE